MRSVWLLALALALALPAPAAAAKRAGIWKALRRPLFRHIRKNLRENEGFYLIEDADQANAWMTDFVTFDRARIRRVHANEYIVRGKFVEMAQAGDIGGGGMVLKVDFTLRRDQGPWWLAEEALQSVDGRVFFSYNKAGEREYADPSESLSITLVFEDEPEKPGEVKTRVYEARPIVGKEPPGHTPTGAAVGSWEAGDDPNSGRRRYFGPGSNPSNSSEPDPGSGINKQQGAPYQRGNR